MIKRLLALDGVQVICLFRDDGSLVEGYGMLDEDGMARLAHFAHEYKRMVQGNADQLSMFTQLRGWTPPRGWIVRGEGVAVCSVGNLVCLADHREASLNEVMREMAEAASY
jgi:roadblock/LC7 domain-containing protein